MVECLLENNILELLVQRLVSFDESNEEEATGVFNTLSIIENLAEVKPEVAEAIAEKTKVRVVQRHSGRALLPPLSGECWTLPDPLHTHPDHANNLAS